jgi:hypothetical protein
MPALALGASYSSVTNVSKRLLAQTAAMKTPRKTMMPRAEQAYDKTDFSSLYECSERRKELKAMLTADNYMALEARCIREFGLAAGVLARQLVYWEGKGHDPDGWIYKTKAELREEVGLSSGMVDTARRRLEDRGVLKTDRRPKRRPDGRIKHPSPVIHYQLDLLKLAQILGILDNGTTLNHESKPRESTTFNYANSHPSTMRNGAFHTHRVSPKTQPESSPFQGGDGPSDRPAPLKDRSKPSPEEEHLDNDVLTRGMTPRREPATEVKALIGHLQPLPFKQASAPPQLGAETKNKVWWTLTGGEGENDVTRSVDRYLEGGADVNGGSLTMERVAGKVQEHIGSDEPLEAFVPWVERCLEHMRMEREVAERIG